MSGESERIYVLRADLDAPYFALAAALLGFGVRATLIFRRHERRGISKAIKYFKQ